MNEQEIEFFREAKRIQELWEPKFGDWVRLAPHDLYDFENGIIVLPVELPYTAADNAEDIVVVRTDDHQHLLLYPNELIWLPRLDQLIEMLEERGYFWRVSRPAPIKPNYAAIRWATEDPDEIGKVVTGPTPSIALGRALIEVLKEE